jgi:YggT family protein
MAAIITFVFFIVSALLSLLWWAIIISAVLSWLVAFDMAGC